MVAIKTIFKIGEQLFKYGRSAGRFTSGEASFVNRFPPNYRADIRTILKGVSTVTTGGIIADFINLDDELSNDAEVPFQNAKVPASGKYQKTRDRFTRRSSDRYSCDCNNCRRRRRSNFS